MSNIIPQNGAEKKSEGLDRLLTGPEVAAHFRVAKTTVRGWARTGRLASVLIPGGQRRFPESTVLALLKAVTG